MSSSTATFWQHTAVNVGAYITITAVAVSIIKSRASTWVVSSVGKWNSAAEAVEALRVDHDRLTQAVTKLTETQERQAGGLAELSTMIGRYIDESQAVRLALLKR